MKISRYNVVVVGQTGVGKSTFINYLYGENVAPTGIGKPVTQNGFHPYDFALRGMPVRLFDSWGLEVDKYKEWMRELDQELVSRGLDKSADEWFHSIFYCIGASSHRIQDCDIDIVNKFLSVDYNVSIILTKCDNLSTEEEESLKKALHERLPNIPVICVCSERKITRGGAIEPFGKDHVENQAFRAFFDSIVTRLPKRCKELMVTRLSEWEKNSISQIDKLGLFGANEEDKIREIKSSYELMIEEVVSAANTEISDTLRLYRFFADHLGYPPPSIAPLTSSGKGKNKEDPTSTYGSNEIHWWEWTYILPFGIVYLAYNLGDTILNGRSTSQKKIARLIRNYKLRTLRAIDRNEAKLRSELSRKRDALPLIQQPRDNN